MVPLVTELVSTMSQAIREKSLTSQLISKQSPFSKHQYFTDRPGGVD